MATDKLTALTRPSKIDTPPTPPEPDLLAHLEGILVSFARNAPALDRLTLTIKRGECLGILGPNGAGKTTLLRVLAGLLLPDTGQISLFGQTVEKHTSALRCRLGYIAQRSGLDPYLSGMGNLLLLGRLHGLHGATLDQRVHELLELVGLRTHASRRVEEYSGGMQRRLALACSLIHTPDLLLLDEPTAGLDAGGKAALWHYLQQLQQGGLTLVFASHDTQEIERYANRVALMSQGKIIADGSPAALIALIHGDVLTLEFADSHNLLTASAVLKDAPSIHRITPQEETPREGTRQIALEVADGSTAIPQVIHLLDRAGLHTSRLILSHPTLEDVFFRMTGAALVSSRTTPDDQVQTRQSRPGFRRRTALRQRDEGAQQC